MPINKIKLFNLARMITMTEGTGIMALHAPVRSYLSFEEAGARNGDMITYAIEDGAHREMGRGLYSSSGSTLTRSVLRSTDNNNPIDLSGGAQVGIMAAAEDLPNFDNRGFTTGDVKTTFKTAPDPGWVMMDDGTIGDPSSGADNAYSECEALFALLFANTTGANVPLLTSTGAATTRAAHGNSAMAAWDAHCRISLPRTLGRALACAGQGAGMSNRALGQTLGIETKSLTVADNANHGHNTQNVGPFFAWMLTFTIHTYDWNVNNWGCHNWFTNLSPQGASAPFSVMNPTNYLNVMICL